MNRLLILIGKIIVKILHLFKRNAGNLPGIILWHLTRGKCCKMFKVSCPIIAVTGTNGKTSVTNCIAQLFQQSGKKIIINKEGNNLDTGICSLLLRYCDSSGMVNADYLILETDAPYVKPERPEDITGKKWKNSRNTSLILPTVAAKIAELKGMMLEDVLKVTEDNTRKVFDIKENQK